MFVSKRTVFLFEIAAVVALMVSLGIFIASFFMDVHHHAVEYIEGAVITVFLLEVGVQFIHADDKKAYLRKNWFYILTILPIVAILKAFRLGKLSKLVKVIQLAQHSKILGSEQIIARMGAMLPALMLGKQFLSMIYHVKRADFTCVPRALKTRYIDLFISKQASRPAVNGLKQGIRDFHREQGNKVIFCEQQVSHVPLDFSRLETHPTRMRLFVTHEEVPGFSMLGTDTGILSANLSYGSEYEHISQAKLEHLRGYTVGYNAFARKHKPCFHHNCIHKKLNPRRLDIYSFLTHLHEHVPRCEYHAS
ncbi:MAG: hypothetical protein ACQESG_02675 [Nanobdellota archaeon]